MTTTTPSPTTRYEIRPPFLFRWEESQQAHVLLYPEVGHSVADWLHRQYGMPCVRTTPMGWRATNQFVSEVCALAGVPVPDRSASRARWWSESVDAHYLTGKRVFGVTGWKNAGKTTLATRLIAELTRRGWRVCRNRTCSSDERRSRGRWR